MALSPFLPLLPPRRRGGRGVRVARRPTARAVGYTMPPRCIGAEYINKFLGQDTSATGPLGWVRPHLSVTTNVTLAELTPEVASATVPVTVTETIWPSGSQSVEGLTATVSVGGFASILIVRALGFS